MGKEPIMAGQIRIDPGTMRQRAHEYTQRGDDINQIIARMDSMLAQLQDEWKGAASEAYANRYNSELKPSFQKAVQLTQEISQALSRTADQMEQQDAAIAQGFQG